MHGNNVSQRKANLFRIEYGKIVSDQKSFRVALTLKHDPKLKQKRRHKHASDILE